MRRSANHGRDRKSRDACQHEAAAPHQVTQTSDTHDETGDCEQVGQHDPLNGLKRAVEDLYESRQCDIGNAGAE